ncbi:MAG: hypothetical protein EOM87_08535 [Clostridia bacterium]|nr:hypothetical protein [Clostridia bacterium]
MIAYVAEVNIEYAVESYCLTNELIKAAAVIEYNDTLIVAVMTRPVYTRSERDRLIKSLGADIGEKYCRNAIVTADLEVYSKILMYQSGRDVKPSDIYEIAQRRAP